MSPIHEILFRVYPSLPYPGHMKVRLLGVILDQGHCVFEIHLRIHFYPSKPVRLTVAFSSRTHQPDISRSILQLKSTSHTYGNSCESYLPVLSENPLSPSLYPLRHVRRNARVWSRAWTRECNNTWHENEKPGVNRPDKDLCPITVAEACCINESMSASRKQFWKRHDLRARFPPARD